MLSLRDADVSPMMELMETDPATENETDDSLLLLPPDAELPAPPADKANTLPVAAAWIRSTSSPAAFPSRVSETRSTSARVIAFSSFRLNAPARAPDVSP